MISAGSQSSAEHSLRSTATEHLGNVHSLYFSRVIFDVLQNVEFNAFSAQHVCNAYYLPWRPVNGAQQNGADPESVFSRQFRRSAE